MCLESARGWRAGLLGDNVAVVASCQLTADAAAAEVALAVADEMHGRGIATLLLDTWSRWPWPAA